MLLIIVASILVIAAFVFLAIKARKAGFLEDDNGNYIPDVVEDRAKKVKDEVASRAKEVSKEVSDVGAALKEVGKQASHIPGAVAGKRRAGKKK
jgi:hypothetical protein